MHAHPRRKPLPKDRPQGHKVASHMRFYFPESPQFRFFRQKQDCHALTESAPVDMGREAPKNKDDVRQAQEVKQAIAKAPPRANEAAHRFLDQVEAVHKWWTTPFAASSPSAAPAAAAASDVAKTKPFDPLDLQDVPDAEQASGYKLDPALQRKWFGNPAYAVQSREQKECLSGAPFYPPTLVDSSTLKLDDLLKTERKIERIQLAVDKIKSPAFLNSKPVQEALRKVCSRLHEGYGFDVDPQAEFKGDLQQMHRKYVFASVTVGKRFLQGLDDIRVGDLDKSADVGDDLALALGEFKVYAAIQNAYVAYHGRTTRKVTIKEIAIYIMAPYGFDAFGPDVPYLGHFNKKHFALVTDGEWVNAPVYSGKDPHAKNALMRPVSIPLYIQWRQKHNKGGDMLLFSERRPSFPNLEVVVPLRSINPRVTLIGRIAADYFGYVTVPHSALHFTLAMFDTEWGTVCVDGQPTSPKIGGDIELLIQSHFYYNELPTKVLIEIPLEAPPGMETDEFVNRLYAHAQNFASYTESYSLPMLLFGSRLWPKEYNSNSYMAGLLNSVMGLVPVLNLHSQDGNEYVAPGWTTPLPDSCFARKAK